MNDFVAQMEPRLVEFVALEAGIGEGKRTNAARLERLGHAEVPFAFVAANFADAVA